MGVLPKHSSVDGSFNDDLAPRKRQRRSKQDSPKEKEPSIFADLKEEEDYYYKKIQDYYDQMREICALEVKLTEQLKQFITSDKIKGTDMKLVIQKELFPSDLNPNQNRLSMPIMKLETQEFLTPKEKIDLKNEKDIKVRLVGPRLEVYRKPIKLRLWKMEKTVNLVLKTNWSHFVADNKEDFIEWSWLQVWSFRKDQQLYFAFVCLKRPTVIDDD